MHRLSWAAAALVLFAAGHASAQSCAGDRVGGPGDPSGALSAFLLGKVVCGSEVGGTDRWQEEHRSGGVLFERARGPGDPVDPSREVGQWTTQGPAGDEQVCYTYGTSGPYCFAVIENTSPNYTYCNGTTAVATAAIRSASEPCPGAPAP
jgi:hypothetical protein